MQDFDRDYTQMMGMPSQYYPMATLPKQKLETMYPKTYNIIHPAVESTCDKMAAPYGHMYTPTQEQLEAMIDDVYAKVEVDVDVAINQSPREEERQFFGGGRRLLRDFIGTMLIGSLLGRRRPHFYGYPGYYGGGFGGYWGYPFF